MNKMKNLFATPQKAVISSLCLLVILAGLKTGTAYAASAIAQSSAIGAENAQNFAFADAGVDPASAKAVRTEFDFEQGQFVYEIEFTADGTVYEYWIKSSTGAVVKKELEMVSLDGKDTTAAAQITLEEAKDTALADAGLGQAQVTYTQEKLDVEDGVSMYDIEFYFENVWYEYEINANTGAIYSKSREIMSVQETKTAVEAPKADTADKTEAQVPNNAGGAGSYIGVEQAKSIAVGQAGFTASDVTFKKAKLEHDDGYVMYEIEFYKDGMEYECSVDAVTGAVLEYDYETDD